LSQSFAVAICAYAVMSNHTHVVLYVDQSAADAWSLDDIIQRWHSLFAGISLSHRHLQGDALCGAEQGKLREVAEAWLQLTSRFEIQFCHLVGRPDAVQSACAQFGKKWAWGASHCKAVFSP